MSRPRWVILAVTALVVVSSVGATAMSVSADQTKVHISDVSVSNDEPVTGETVTVTAEVSTLETSNETIDIKRVQVRKSNSAKTYRRVEDIGSLAPGGSVSVPMTVSFDNPGMKSLTVYVLVQGENGGTEAYEYPVSIEVSELNVNADLSVTTDDNKSTAVEFTNYGNVNVSDIELTATADEETIAQKYLFETEPDTSRSVAFDTEGLNGEEVTVTATYTAQEETYTTTTTHVVDYPLAGEMRLTSIETTQSGSGVTIQGDSANIGNTDAESVLVSVEDTDNVSPTSPLGDYYIGTVEAGEFSTFELTAEVEGATSSVPVEIMYIVDNDRVTTTQLVDVSPGSSSAVRSSQTTDTATGQESPGGSGLPLTSISTVLAVLVVSIVGFGIYRWRNP